VLNAIEAGRIAPVASCKQLRLNAPETSVIHLLSPITTLSRPMFYAGFQPKEGAKNNILDFLLYGVVFVRRVGYRHFCKDLKTREGERK
jgi:hypothetical protein